MGGVGPVGGLLVGEPVVTACIGHAMGMTGGWQAPGRRGRREPPYYVGGCSMAGTAGQAHGTPA